MERVEFDEGDPGRADAAVERRGLSDPLGTTAVAINRYRVPPGEGLPAGLHAHTDQEEVFAVLAGSATFETLVPPGVEDGVPDWEADGDPDAREITVEHGEAVRFGPGEFQSGRNGGDGDLVVLAMGAPRDSEDVRIPVDCPECGRGDLQLAFGGEELTFACPDCGAERVPAECPSCGDPDLRVTLADGSGTAVECDGCGARYGDPPYR